MNVALIVMPFAAVDKPSIAAGLLKAQLKKQDIECDCKYFNFIFKNLIGISKYEKIIDSFPTTTMACEWVFSQLYFGQEFSNWESYKGEVLSHTTWGLDSSLWEMIKEMISIAPTFIRLAFESNDWNKYNVIGFTSSFEQTLPSMCLAKLIKKEYPNKKIIIGGANFEGSMGQHYIEVFPELDYVATGEADFSFPILCKNISRNIKKIPLGIISRGNLQRSIDPNNQDHIISDLDSLQTPDYTDFIKVFGKTKSNQQATIIPMEASRGCWWGEKHKCTFCGQNGLKLKYRKKTWTKVRDEADELIKKYRPDLLQFTDNILAMDFFKTLIPHWVESINTVPKFFEVKANLNRKQLILLKKAGVYCVQPGIESLSDNSLRIMNKGVSAAHNVALLRWSKEIAILLQWNLIFGFPGEVKNDYDEMLKLMMKITHLRAPEVCAPIRLDRFSPNYEYCIKYGFGAITPMSAYKHVYPLSSDKLAQLAYYFEYSPELLEETLKNSKKIMDFGRLWKSKCRKNENGVFTIQPHISGRSILVDSRFTKKPKSIFLSDEELDILFVADKPIKRYLFFKKLVNRFTNRDLNWKQILKKLFLLEVIAHIGDYVVALPTISRNIRIQLMENEND